MEWGGAPVDRGCLVKVDPEEPDEDAVRRAASALMKGGLVAFPTETVYGLGADAFNADAARRIFQVKGRPADNPLIVHVEGPEGLWRVASSVPEEAWRLVERLWPGPLTIVVPRDPIVPKVVTGGLETVAVRSPAHRVALKLIETANLPIAAPSANRSGRPSPTSGLDVLRDLDCSVDLILDAGETFFGVESTIIDFTRHPPVVLRPGPITPEDVERVIGVRPLVTPETRALSTPPRPLAPGMKYRHYSPDAHLALLDEPGAPPEGAARALACLAGRLQRGLGRTAILATDETAGEIQSRGLWRDVWRLGPRGDPIVAARRLYRLLRRLDEEGYRAAAVEAVNEEGIGLAVMNRLRKASSERYTLERALSLCPPH